MGLYAGNPAAWIDDVYQFDVTDVVQGGPGGIDNVPLKNLADRTAWLKNQLGVIQGHTELAANTIITAALHSGHLITATATGANPATPSVIVLTLDDANSFKENTIISFAACELLGAIKIVGSIPRYGAAIPNLILHNNEFVTLKAEHGAGLGTWRIVSFSGNMFCVGEEIKARKILPGTIPMIGQIVSRDLLPRLFAFVQSLTVGQEVVSEAAWLGDPLVYRGCFTLGDGVSNFRIPDERAMFDRMLDLGRGISIGRPHNFPGGYEADNNKSHNHTNGAFSKLLTITGNFTIRDVDSSPLEPNMVQSADMIASGGPEAVSKNIGKYNLIKY